MAKKRRKEKQNDVQYKEAEDNADEIDWNVFGYWTNEDIVEYLRGGGGNDPEGKVKAIVQLNENIISESRREE